MKKSEISQVIMNYLGQATEYEKLNPLAKGNPQHQAEREAVLAKNTDRTKANAAAALGASLKGRHAQIPFSNIVQSDGFTSQEEFEASEDTLAKRLQEQLAHPADRFETHLDQDPEEAISSIIVDARSQALQTLADLFGAPKPAPRTPKHLRIAHYAAYAGRVKAELAKLQPVDQDPEDPDLGYLRILKTPSGILAVNNREQRHYAFTDLHGAHRQVEIKLTQLKGEQEKLTKLKAAFTKGASTPREIRDLYGQVVDYFGGVKNPRNKNRKRHKELLEIWREALKIQGLDRPADHPEAKNKKRVLEKIEGANLDEQNQKFITGELNEITQRLDELEGIIQVLEEDKAIIEKLILDNNQPLEKFIKQVEEIGDRLHSLNPEKLAANPDLKSRSIAGLKALRNQSYGMELAPYKGFADVFRIQVDKLIAAIEAGEDTRELFTELYAIAKLKKAHQSMMTLCSDLQKIDLSSVEIVLDYIEKCLRDRQIQGELRTHTLDPAYIAFYELIRSLRQVLINRQLREVTEETARRQLKKHIKAHNTVNILKELIQPLPEESLDEIPF